MPSTSVSGRVLYRVWRRHGPEGERLDPWWFASRPADPATGGRFDLAAPMGTCYLATSAAGAVLEALQLHLTALPVSELTTRRLARIEPPGDAPRAAQLTSRRLASVGVTAALWAAPDRALTQRWAAAFRRDGWWALYSGLQHDPPGQLRGVALFDHAGAHPPSHGTGRWRQVATSGANTAEMVAALAAHGIAVRGRGELPFASPPELE